MSTGCIGGDPLCPCQDGLACHYVDDGKTKGFPVTAKTATERNAKRRAGLVSKRWELSPPPHPDDRPAIKSFADKLARKRAKQKAG